MARSERNLQLSRELSLALSLSYGKKISPATTPSLQFIRCGGVLSSVAIALNTSPVRQITMPHEVSFDVIEWPQSFFWVIRLQIFQRHRVPCPNCPQVFEFLKKKYNYYLVCLEFTFNALLIGRLLVCDLFKSRGLISLIESVFVSLKALTKC